MDKIKYFLIGLLLLVVASASGWFVTKSFISTARQFKQPLIELKRETAVNTGVPAALSNDAVAVKIFLSADEGEGITVEELKIRNNPIPVKMAEAIMAEYLKGLKYGLKDTKLLGIYRDKRSIIYIDLSEEFRKNFSGDVKQEYSLLKSLYETITVNIPGTEDVRVLIDGKEVESIGGHFSALYPLGDTVRDDLQQTADQKPG